MDSEELGNAYGPQVHFDAFGEGKSKEDKMLARLNKRIEELEEEMRWQDLADGIHEINAEKGFWGPPEMMDKYAAKMMLVVTETSEVVEALRKSQGKDKVTEEFADIFIRALDLYKVLVDADEADPRLYKVLLDKVETNRVRPPKHGNRWG